MFCEVVNLYLVYWANNSLIKTCFGRYIIQKYLFNPEIKNLFKNLFSLIFKRHPSHKNYFNLLPKVRGYYNYVGFYCTPQECRPKGNQPEEQDDEKEGQNTLTGMDVFYRALQLLIIYLLF